MSDKPEFIDPGGVVDFFATDIHAIERMGPVSRIMFGIKKRSAAGNVYVEAAFAVIVPTALLHEIAAMCAQGGHEIDAVGAPDEAALH